MRQVGVLAAPGIVALESMVDRLQEDHDNARILAQGLAEIRGIEIEPDAVETNIVLFELTEQEPLAFVSALAKGGVLALPHGPREIRVVTHYGISREDIEETLERVRQACSAGV